MRLGKRVRREANKLFAHSMSGTEHSSGEGSIGRQRRCAPRMHSGLVLQGPCVSDLR